MTSHNINLVQKSWQLVAKIDAETVGALFYNRLFEIMPEVKPMFSRTPLPEQSKKLLGMLTYVISKLDKLDDILHEVTKLARRHVQYGVQEAHYAAVGSALIWTLQNGLGDYWDDPLEAAWTEVYTALSSAMIAASKEALPAAQPSTL